MLETLTVFRFPGGAPATLAEVGGKGLSLIKGSESGLPVPPGFVLAVEFFGPWLDDLAKTPEWAAFIKASPEGMQSACSALKGAAANLTFTAAQRSTIDQPLATFGEGALFAVRSSSPEEDLEGASFAGGYETILGVGKPDIESAVRRAFASCLDFRVAAYKKEHGFDVSSPKIAVVVQQQIASEVAGVGFSINPLSNNFDEVVINANFGLGETVVAGLATPDTFTVDKQAKQITSKVAGGKETSIWLEQNGGTVERPAEKRTEPSLSDSQILELAALVANVEKLYGKPIDTEWALADGRFYLLQARPITAYVPVAPNMMSEPGAQKSLYLDVTIVVQGLYKPISVMGTNVLATMIGAAGEHIFGTDPLGPPPSSVVTVQNGRIYLNTSVLMAVVGKEKIVAVSNAMDPMTSRALAEADEAEYKLKHEGLVLPPFHLLMKLPELAVHLIEARLLPEHAHKNVQRDITEFMADIANRAKENRPVWELAPDLLGRTFKFIFGHSIPLFIASRIALSHLQEIAKHANGGTLPDNFAKLERALPHNVTTEMGLALYHLAMQDPRAPGYKDEWNHFLDLYGHRGPEELDIAAPRYRDLTLLEEQIETLRKSKEDGAGDGENPQKRFDEAKGERAAAYAELCAQIEAHDGGGKLKNFQSLYRVYENLAGYREVHKYLLIYAIDRIRRRLLAEGAELAEASRLESQNQVFDLVLDDLKKAAADSKYDLCAAAKNNRAFADRLAAVPSLPSLFDSRGRILRPTPPQPKEGEVAGTPISPGVIRGRIKVLHSPDEKPLLRGEILVARATDPGWTPLFINAAAVILEIGGMLQHGALVAREYGLPCVSGIAGATTIWEDGTLVEVDGTAGIIRLVKE